MRKPKSDPVDVKVGENLRRIRVARGLSQEALAKGQGITFQQVQKYEKGTNRISASRMAGFAKALGCKLTDLFEGVDIEGATTTAIPFVSSAGMRLAGLYDRLQDRHQKAAIMSLVASIAGAETASDREAA